VERYEMIGIAGDLRVMLLTRHMPLRRALTEITTARVVEHLRSSTRAAPLRHRVPCLALAGLNPHAGEAGILVKKRRRSCARRGSRALARDDVSGRAPDTVFLQARAATFDGVLALYHDQAFIPISSSPRDGGRHRDRRIALPAGQSCARTAFDIAGRGKASPAI